MADHKQMIAFAKRVSRLRFHSQCAPNGSDGTTGNQAPSPGTSPSSSTTGTSGLQHFKARLIKRSFSMPNIQKPVFCEESEVVVEIRGETSGKIYIVLWEILGYSVQRLCGERFVQYFF